ncbi:HET-domain-containing protein [Apiospora sp. TS-2023a]
MKKHAASTYTATLLAVMSNTACPLCRLIRHILHVHGGIDSAYHYEEWDPAEIRCHLGAIRADYGEDISYQNLNTQEMLATWLQVRLVANDPRPDKRSSPIRWQSWRAGIRLLSPESVVPTRPLLNGFRATSLKRGLGLVKQWIGTCENDHIDTCQFNSPNDLPFTIGLDSIQVIDVRNRCLRSFDPKLIKYATLSYRRALKGTALSCAWNNRGGYDGMRQVVDILSMGRPFCIHQADPGKKAAEIKAMGYIYHLSQITIVAGSSSPNGAHLVPATSPTQEKHQTHSKQRIETIGNRQYITSLPSIGDQIIASPWSDRGWTYQEGQMARRIAFLGDYDVSFLCGAGHWRESIHSGEFGHDARLPGLDLHSKRYSALSSYTWLRQKKWRFQDYESIMSAYSQRNLSYESDRMDAISGCFNILTHSQGICFVKGLPTVDFHYALLWTLEEYDRRREGFPSWSWAGWYMQNQLHYMYPFEEPSGSLILAKDGTYSYRSSETKAIELDGLLISSGMEGAHRANKCAQKLARLSVSGESGILTIESEVARFFIDIKPDPSPPDYDSASKEGWEIPSKGVHGRVPSWFDSTKGQYSADWEPDSEYYRPGDDRLCLRNASGDVYPIYFPAVRYWPTLVLGLPMTLRGSTLTWLLSRGIEMVKIVDIELLEGEDDMKPFHYVLCLGIDGSDSHPDYVQRMGIFYLSKDVWEKAGPRHMSVKFR